MRRLALILTSILFIFTGINTSAESTEQELPAKFTALADKAQDKCTELSQEEWKAMNEEFNILCDRYKEARKDGKLTSKEKKTINDAIGKYHSATVKSGYNDIAEGAKNIITKEIPDLWGEMTSGISSFFRGLGKKKK